MLAVEVALDIQPPALGLEAQAVLAAVVMEAVTIPLAPLARQILEAVAGLVDTALLLAHSA